jgi:hypothetical protein
MEENEMVKGRFIGGLLMMLAGAIIMLFAQDNIPLPVSIGLLVVGIALIASSRRRAKSQV